MSAATRLPKSTPHIYLVCPWMFGRGDDGHHSPHAGVAAEHQHHADDGGGGDDDDAGELTSGMSAERQNEVEQGVGKLFGS